MEVLAVCSNMKSFGEIGSVRVTMLETAHQESTCDLSYSRQLPT